MNMWIPAFITTLLLALQKIFKGESVDSYPSSVRMWEPLVTTFAPQFSIPPEFALKWIEIESGGNPCSVGSVWKPEYENNPKFKKENYFGPDGNPKELGLGQLYNPDDLKNLGIDGDKLRAYCEYPQKQTRPLTIEEQSYAIVSLFKLIERCKHLTDAALTNSRVFWSPRSKDYWRMVKLRHALPVITSPGLANVTKKLGRAPIDWVEFRKTYEAINPSAKYNPNVDRKHQSREWRSLQNSEECGSVIKGFANV